MFAPALCALDNINRVMDKHGKFERKVEVAYSKFNEKVAAVNARSGDKRDQILSKERGGGREEQYGPNEDRGPENGYGQRPGGKDLKL